MLTINNLSLADAKPTDYPHLLLWNYSHDAEIYQLAFNNNAQIISYRKNLLSRIDSKQKYLIFHENISQELAAIIEICSHANKPIVILKDLEILITYLYSQPSSPLSLFWHKLGNMRHLESILWILLPTQIHPINWNKKRITTIV
ncbi:hypothetical protein A0J48_016320 [Sphaerospermopsis aphanizomenoides BCCUSP55]|uniref:hypothetical protein n=1 Tax=Sphaerospermopsis aphanizomenoides TaxID=459663 RepID=UPI001903EF66|nr:hypothetical protein [Sphaerospermopsis aphanizomenoides]MBK1989084.1 hypothetical protein [Sphaerospermopsis aphanizomenoides BCCUSP55]